MEATPRVLVIGGTRGTGRLIVDRLLGEGYRVRVLARGAARAREQLPATVEVVEGDITRPETLPAALRDVDHIVFTAGVTGRFAGESLVKATGYDGVRNTLAAAKAAGFQGRFLYMTPVGVGRASLAAAALNLVKRNTLKWRKRAEAEVRGSGLDVTIIRTGVLTDAPGGRRAIRVGQEGLPLSFRQKISRADVAEVFAQALQHPGTRRTTFEVVGGGPPQAPAWDALFSALSPDP